MQIHDGKLKTRWKEGQSKTYETDLHDGKDSGAINLTVRVETIANEGYFIDKV